uniref:Uncharacterized protein n=1 Tax=Globodera rostochiensis TaxID=31243 RepID=A0A914I8Y2_GLORO
MDKEAVTNYDGPRVENKDDPTLSYFHMNGVWYIRHKYVRVNLPCDDKPPPAHVIKEWMKKYGAQQGLKTTTTQQSKQKITTPAKTKFVKRKHSIDEEDDLPKNKKHRLTAGAQMESSSASVPLGRHSSKSFNKRTVESPTPIKPLLKSFNKIDPSVLLQSTSSGKKSFHKMPYVEPQPSTPTAKMPSEQKQPMPTLNAPTERVAPTKANESVLRPIMITTTDQLIKEAKDNLKRTHSASYEKLMERIEIRKMIMEPSADESGSSLKGKLKPFDWAGMKPDQVLRIRGPDHEAHCNETHDLISQLLNADIIAEKLKYRNVLQKDTFRPVPSRLEGKRSEAVPVEELANFMECNDLAILNIDRFITATDKRTPIYDGEGNCIFCKTHGLPNAGTHSTTMDCPYTICTCVQCYMGCSGGVTTIADRQLRTGQLRTTIADDNCGRDNCGRQLRTTIADETIADDNYGRDNCGRQLRTTITDETIADDKNLNYNVFVVRNCLVRNCRPQLSSAIVSSAIVVRNCRPQLSRPQLPIRNCRTAVLGRRIRI